MIGYDGKYVDRCSSLMDLEETYAVLGACLTIKNTTVCQKKDLRKLDESSCMPRLLRVGHAICNYLRNDQEIVELEDNGTLYLTNFNGTMATTSMIRHL